MFFISIYFNRILSKQNNECNQCYLYDPKYLNYCKSFITSNSYCSRARYSPYSMDFFTSELVEGDETTKGSFLYATRDLINTPWIRTEECKRAFIAYSCALNFRQGSPICSNGKISYGCTSSCVNIFQACGHDENESVELCKEYSYYEQNNEKKIIFVPPDSNPLEYNCYTNFSD
jgi:hypothetical protein